MEITPAETSAALSQVQVSHLARQAETRPTAKGKAQGQVCTATYEAGSAYDTQTNEETTVNGKMNDSVFNRQARKSGGYRPARFNLPDLSKDDLEILRQEMLIRKEFGEEGVKRFWESLPEDNR